MTALLPIFYSILGIIQQNPSPHNASAHEAIETVKASWGTIKMMTLNVGADLNDPVNILPVRIPRITRMLEFYNPDILAIQSSESPHAVKSLEEALSPKYTAQSSDGNRLAIFYRSSRFQSPSSKAINIGTGGSAMYLKIETGMQPIHIYNVLTSDRKGAKKDRIKAAAKLWQNIVTANRQIPVRRLNNDSLSIGQEEMHDQPIIIALSSLKDGRIVTAADFLRGNLPVKLNTVPDFEDAIYDVQAIEGRQSAMTYHAYNGEIVPRIKRKSHEEKKNGIVDFILSRNMTPLKTIIATWNELGLFPSPHYPVITDFNLTIYAKHGQNMTKGNKKTNISRYEQENPDGLY